MKSTRPEFLPTGMFLEICQHSIPQDLPQTARLKFFLPSWERITQDPWVLEVIQGYKIELVTPPVQQSLPPVAKLSLTQEAVLEQEVNKLLVKQAIHPIHPSNQEVGFISSMFVVPKKDGGSRPVVNLKPLNQYLAYEHFKMEGIHMLRDLLKKGDFLVKIDLKDAYLTVPIWKNHQKYLRFLWKGSMLEFGCLPFGLATAPRVFTKLMKPVVGALRQRGIRLIIYLDDLLILAESHDQALHHAASTLNLLEGLGFIVNYQKSQLLPSQKIEFLGFLIDSNTMTLQLPGEKLRKIRKKCQELLAQTTVSVRELSKFLGLLTSSIQAIFPAPLHYRHLQRLKNTTLASQKTYNAMVALDQAAHEEILWWKDHLHAWNGRALFQDPVDLVIETDASRKGCGAYCQGVRTGGPWSFEEKRLHINCLELLAGSLAVKTFTKSKVCAHVKLLMDSTSAVAYINKMGGTHSKSLANLAIDLWEWCFQNHLIVSAQHLPGRLNVRADRESRVLEDSSDWKLSPDIFQTLQNKWGPFEVDLFASRLTKQLPKFASWKPDPMAAYTDAFSLDWGQILGYAFPPFALIGRCVRQLRSQKVDQLVLVAPVWPTQPWYPLLLQMCVEPPLLFPMFPQLLTKGSQLHPLGNIQLAGWKLSASIIKQQTFQQKLETFCWLPGDKTPVAPMPLPGVSGYAGVVNGKLIHFQHLSKSF